MTSVIRTFFALVSCLLLTAGLANAAHRVDQVISGKTTHSEMINPGSSQVIHPGAPCIIPDDKR